MTIVMGMSAPRSPTPDPYKHASSFTRRLAAELAVLGHAWRDAPAPLRLVIFAMSVKISGVGDLGADWIRMVLAHF
jgi:hypothetical protein